MDSPRFYGAAPAVGSRTQRPPASPAAILIDSPRTARLKKKLNTDCTSTAARMDRVRTDTSEVWTATEMVNAKYMKSTYEGDWSSSGKRRGSRLAGEE